jgi:hypothetical protein
MVGIFLNFELSASADKEYRGGDNNRQATHGSDIGGGARVGIRLAATYRLAEKYGMSELIYTHIFLAYRGR